MSIDFHRMYTFGNNYIVNRRTSFEPTGIIEPAHVYQAAEFAWRMAHEEYGHCKDTRTGGCYRRTAEDKILHNFYGKLGEFGFYEYMSQKDHIWISEPNCDTYGKSEWDNGDFMINGYQYDIKTVKHFSQLLLLETGDRDLNGNYKYSEEQSEATILIRVKADQYLENAFQNNKNHTWKQWLDFIRNANPEIQYQIVGFLTKNDLQSIIQNQYIIPQNAFLNNKQRIDADNYYVQAGDLRHISDLEIYDMFGTRIAC